MSENLHSETSEPLSAEPFESDVDSNESKDYEDLHCHYVLLSEQYDSLKEKYFILLKNHSQGKST